jgi:hypothetical protein
LVPRWRVGAVIRPRRVSETDQVAGQVRGLHLLRITPVTEHGGHSGYDDKPVTGAP